MKKIILLILALCLMASCMNPHMIIGDEMVVTSVKQLPNGVYETKYVVEVSSLNENSQYCTFNGNHLRYYTNTLYSVGDTLTINFLKK